MADESFVQSNVIKKVINTDTRVQKKNNGTWNASEDIGTNADVRPS